MRSLDDAVNRFVYHPATPDTAKQHAALRDLFVDFVPKVWDLLPDGPDKTLVIRDLERALQMGNAAIAMQAPADLSAGRSVARVLPDTAVGRVGPVVAEDRGCGCGKCAVTGG